MNCYHTPSAFVPANHSFAVAAVVLQCFSGPVLRGMTTRSCVKMYLMLRLPSGWVGIGHPAMRP